ncbi:helix-turn-helix domain-containing protein [Novosphingobium sp. Leaf2]|uniref:helix-turn-helix domain-containing protein n=1 Tax=Novosphingobium sp. Leaf2 TaxID=1735670 RepID=UPI0006F7C03F|nr:helix-turn-helix domain-containing protein [Novosphingobium sp. Leaf2]KQM21615.1 AraC family transcriptional regulator [Novosphingobium sp. Leaf2]
MTSASSPSSAERASIPAFYLYGEPQRDVETGFVHVESLDDRSRPSEWTIEPHIHRHLAHIILIADGGGSMRAEGSEKRFGGPCLLFVPAAVVHGFRWHSESNGFVVTLAVDYLADLLARHPDLSPLFTTAHVVTLPADRCAGMQRLIAETERELSWNTPGQRAAIEIALLSIMTHSLRLMGASAEPPMSPGGRRVSLVARLRERIDARFRLREPIQAHAAALGVSPTALRVACAQVAGRSPAAILDDRALLEARRLLLYSNLTVAQIGYAVGFEDPAYFSRFFTRHTGQPPRRYRERGGAITVKP